MNDPLPSLSALRAFEAAARHLSMTLAARELHVTPGAVSLQIRDLEASLGVQLFVRHARSLSLTGAGADYFQSLRSAFITMREATMALKSRLQPEVITLSCTTGFAMQWLLPRLHGLEAAHPTLDLRIGTTARLVDFSRDGVDLAVRHGLGDYPGLVSERLIDDELVVVATQALAQELARAEPGASPQPEALSGHTLIHDVSRDDWRLWLEGQGASSVDWRKGPVIAADSNGALEAARAGLGFALIRYGFVARDLQDGRLKAPFAKGLHSRFAYYLVYPQRALEKPTTRLLRQWLLEQAGQLPRTTAPPAEETTANAP